MVTSPIKNQNTGFSFPDAGFRVGFNFSVCLVLIYLLYSTIFPSFTFAQDDSNSRIDRLRGGILGMKIKWSGEAFSGLGSRADAMGGSISTLYPGAESLSSNPAGLGFTHGFYLTLDWAPPFTIDPGGLLGIEKGLNESLMETAKNNSPGGVVPQGTVQDAIVNSELDMRGGLKGGAFLYGNHIFAVAASFHEPFRMETQMSMSGMEFNAVALDDNKKVTHRIFGTVNGNLNLEVSFNTSSIGFGTRILPNLGFGIAFDNFNAEQNFSGTMLPEGIISTPSGTERPFNDPQKIQYDSLYAIIKGDWEGSGRRLRWGFGYQPTPDLSLDAAFVLPTNISLSGPFEMIHNSIRALNLGAEGDEEVFDIDKLVEDNLTKTKKIITKVPGIDFEVPGSLALGFSTRWQNYVASLTFTQYLDHVGYRVSYEQFDSLNVKTDAGKLHQGVDLGRAFRAGIGVEQLILGVGVLFAHTFREEVKEVIVPEGGAEPEDGEPFKVDVSDKHKFVIPFFSLGGGFRVTSRFRLDYFASLYNSSFLRFTTSYHF